MKAGPPAKHDQCHERSLAIAGIVPRAEPHNPWRYNIEALAEILRQPAAPPLLESPESLPAPLPSHAPEDVRAAIASLKNLPVLSGIAESFRAAVRNPRTSIDKLASLIRADPALHARILRIANSALLGADYEVTSVSDAIVRLGTERVRHIAQSLHTVTQLSRLSPHFEFRHLWSHSLACALIAENLNLTAGAADPSHIYSAGLLHDVGKIVLAALFPGSYRAALSACARPGEELTQVERRIFGLDHAEAGLLFARSHHLPEPIQLAIAAHGQPWQPDTPASEAVRIVAAANCFAKKYRLGYSGNPRWDAWHLGPDPEASPTSYEAFPDDSLEAALLPILPKLRKELAEILDAAYVANH